MWELEPIPHDNKLFMRIHDIFIRNGKLNPGVFRERGSGKEKGMSTDWERYSTAEQSRERAKIPTENSIGSFIVIELIKLTLQVVHAPISSDLLQNRAHTNVVGIDGENETQNRLLLLQVFKWEIKSDSFTL